MGAINGIGSDGTPLRSNGWIEEAWTPTTIGIASHRIAESLTDEGFATAKGVNEVVSPDCGFLFRTPRASDISGLFRASMYMHRGAIWPMEYALEKKRCLSWE